MLLVYPCILQNYYKKKKICNGMLVLYIHGSTKFSHIFSYNASEL